MPALTLAPATEACQAIVDRINSGNAYRLPTPATYTRKIIDPLEEIEGLRIDVEAVDETQLEETLDIEDRTSHTIRVWIREKLKDTTEASIDRAALVARNVFKRLNLYRTSNGRVTIWQADVELKENPDKATLIENMMFCVCITLRVEVEATFA